MDKTSQAVVVREYVDGNNVRRRVVEVQAITSSAKHMTPNTVIMNSKTALACQGDDDGDLFGFSADEDLVELFSYKLDNDYYLIEPEGIEILDSNGQPLMADSPEGLQYLKTDHRQYVGLLTVYRARLLAVGDHGAARAMSIAIQECIDQAKRKPAWSNIYLAATMNNWTHLPDGSWKFSHKFKLDQLENGGFPIKAVRNWVNNRLMATGCFTIRDTSDGSKHVAVDPLWWRLDGNINVENWQVPEQTNESFAFENLVHHAARSTHKKYHELEETFEIPPAKMPLSTLLPTVLAAHGINCKAVELSDLEYYALADKLGLREYNDGIKSYLGNDLEDRQEQINFLQQNFERTMTAGLLSGTITIDDLVNLWVHETSIGGNPNNAFRVVCWAGSPVMSILDIPVEAKCDYLQEPVRPGKTRLQALVDECNKSPNPFDKLHELITNSTSHELRYFDDQKEGIPFHACPDCMLNAQNGLVQAVRNAKNSSESIFAKQLISKLKN